MSRRRILQVAGFGSGALALALAATSLFSEESPSPSEPESQPSEPPPTPASESQSSTSDNPSSELTFPEPPIVSGNSPDNLSAVEVQTVKVDATGNITERQSAQVNAFREGLGNDIGLDMLSVAAGDFVMGSPEEEPQRDSDEGPQRTVSVPSFFMGRFPITQAQYQAVMDENPSAYQGANRPVERVFWHNAVAFCEKLSQLTGRDYRLPSEAEWEYACRAKTTTPFYFGPTITTDLANYKGTDRAWGETTYPGNYGQGPTGDFREETTDISLFPPNIFGLYDMHGNVWEWCQDVWHGNYENAPTDGSAWIEGGNQDLRVIRGGS